jgi:hypothetical protein
MQESRCGEHNEIKCGSRNLEISLHAPWWTYASDQKPSHLTSKIHSGWENGSRARPSGMGWNCGGTDISIANVRNSQTDTHDGIPRLSSGRPIGIVARTPGKQFQKTDGARRSMWGEDGNDVRLSKLSELSLFWGVLVSDIRYWDCCKMPHRNCCESDSEHASARSIPSAPDCCRPAALGVRVFSVPPPQSRPNPLSLWMVYTRSTEYGGTKLNFAGRSATIA